MGGIKKIRKKYSKPSHPWRAARIQEESAISREYGIDKKTQIWKAIAKLSGYKNQAKKLSALTSPQALKEKEALFQKLSGYSLIKPGETADAILGITLKDVLNRRLQTIVFRRGFSKNMKQARQMITHGHVLVNQKSVTSPAYLVRVAEESTVEVSPKSPFYDTNHPERIKEASKRSQKPRKAPVRNFRRR